MNNAQIVAVPNRVHDRPDSFRCLLLRVILFLNDAVEKLTSLEQLQHQVDIICLIKDFVNLQDVRVVQLRQNVYFSLQLNLIVLF